MNKIIFILVAFFSYKAVFCMEEQERCYLKLLPKEIVKNEILLVNMLLPFIKESLKSKDFNRLSTFFKRISNIKLTNKSLVKILNKYIPPMRQNEPKLMSFESLLVIAVQKDWELIYDLILKNIPTEDIDPDELNAALLYAAINKNSQLFERLINKGADKNTVDDIVHKVFGVSVDDILHNGLNKKFLNPYLLNSMGIKYNKLIYYIVKLLLSLGADVNVTGGYGALGFPLILLVYQKGNENLMRLLLSYPKIKVDAVSAAGLTTLMMAAINGKNNIIQLLLDRGAGIDLQDGLGKTALMHAIEYKRVDSVKLLLEKHANKNEVNNQKQTAYDIALQRYKASSDPAFKTIMELLKEKL